MASARTEASGDMPGMDMGGVSQDVLASITNPQVEARVTAIVTGQQAEITTMEGLLAGS